MAVHVFRMGLGVLYHTMRTRCTAMCDTINIGAIISSYTWQYIYSAWYDVGYICLCHTMRIRCTAMSDLLVSDTLVYVYTWDNNFCAR